MKKNKNLDPTLKSYATFLMLEKGLSEKTIEAYIHDVKLFLKWNYEFNSDKKLKEINNREIHLFIQHLADKNLSARSQARIISGIKSFFSFCLLDEVIEENPTELVVLPQLGKHFPDVISVEEINSIIKSIDLSKPDGHRNKAIIEMLYACGLRVSELVNLTFNDIDFEEEIIRVIGKGNKERLVPIGKEALNALELYINASRRFFPVVKNHEHYIFLNQRGKQLTRASVFNIVKALADLAGIKKSISPHTFRHSFATHMVENGADLRIVQELLGHSSITTTEIYTHLSREYLKDVVEKYHPIYNKR
ncbi:MAG: site-specific tyrosine recombinase XerD [Bacteroidales bacterium]|nr:site-specific tyrosine recombinase XerD [Bacteroidales bacterium]